MSSATDVAMPGHEATSDCGARWSDCGSECEVRKGGACESSMLWTARINFLEL